MNTLGLSWFILNFNGRLSDLGIMLMMRIIPSAVIGPIAGTLVDRMKKKSVIVAADLLLGLLSIGLILANNLPQVYTIVFVQSVLSAFFRPAIRSLFPLIVEKENLTAANALNGISYRVSSLIGPAIGGLIIGVLGVPMLFILNGISFIISAISETFIQYEDTSLKHKKADNSLLQDFKDGFDYIRQHQSVRFVILFFAILSLTGGGWRVLYTAYIKLELALTPALFGILSSAMGIGAVLGAMIVGKLAKKTSSLLLITYGFLLYSASYLLMGMFNHIFLLVPIFLACGALGSIVNVAYDVFLQGNVEPQFMGRVFSFDIAVGDVILLLSLHATGVLGDYFQPSSLLVSYGIVSILLTGIMIVYMKARLDKSALVVETK